MEVERIVRTHHRGDAALRVVRAGGDTLLLRDENDVVLRRGLQREAESGDSAADHQHIARHCLHRILSTALSRSPSPLSKTIRCSTTNSACVGMRSRSFTASFAVVI